MLLRRWGRTNNNSGPSAILNVDSSLNVSAILPEFARVPFVVCYRVYKGTLEERQAVTAETRFQACSSSLINVVQWLNHLTLSSFSLHTLNM